MSERIENNIKKVEKHLKEIFNSEKMEDKTVKMAFSIGYLRGTTLDKDETLLVIKHILCDEI